MFISKQTYEHKYRSLTLYILSFLLICCVGGLVYGWPQLRQQLIDENESSGNPSISEKQLGIIFTVGSWSTQGGRFFVGIARDYFGTRRVMCTCMMFVICGCIGIAWSDTNNVVALAISLFLVGLGSGVQLCTQPVASLFPNHVGIALSSLSGAFQISGLIFLVLTSGPSKSMTSRRISFTSFAGCLVIMTIIAAYFFPQSKSFLLQDGKNNDSKVQSKNEQKEERQQQNEQCQTDNDTGQLASTQVLSESISEQPIEVKHTSKSSHNNEPTVNESEDNNMVERGESSVTKNDETLIDEQGDTENISQSSSPPHYPADDENSHHEDKRSETQQSDNTQTAFQQMKYSEYILLCIWFSICLVPLQYYVGTIGFQLENKGDDSGFYTDIFVYTYAGATITGPISGYIADKVGLGFAQGTATSLVAISFFILSSNNISLDVHTIGLVCYGIGRLAIFGLFFTNCGKRFGYSNYGSLAGLGLLVSAILSLLQYPLIALAADGYSSLVNIISGVVLVAQTPYFVWLHRRERRFQTASDLMQK